MRNERKRKGNKKVVQFDDTIKNPVQLEGKNSSKGESEHVRKSKNKTKIVFKRSKSKPLGEDQKDGNTTSKKVWAYKHLESTILNPFETCRTPKDISMAREKGTTLSNWQPV
ncbi:hypothetical protein AKJ16_DCAP21412 [Drosera capensis]